MMGKRVGLPGVTWDYENLLLRRLTLECSASTRRELARAKTYQHFGHFVNRLSASAKKECLHKMTQWKDDGSFHSWAYCRGIIS